MDLNSFVDRISRSTAFDPAAQQMYTIAHRALPAGRLKSLLSGTPLGHPAHPMLVTLPIGTLVAATALDLVGGPGARGAARKLVALGLLSAAPTAAAGLSDWSDTLGPERRVGLVHAASNLVGLGLYGASYAARRRRCWLRATALGLGGSLALAGGGYLGGHLSYAMGIGVDTTAFQHAPSEWTDVAASGEVALGAPHGVNAAGVPVLLVRTPAGLHALADRCTHRGGPLAEGPLVDGCIECPWHGSRFRLPDGTVARGPASRPQPVYDVREADGRIAVRRTEARTLRTNPVGL